MLSCAWERLWQSRNGYTVANCSSFEREKTRQSDGETCPDSHHPRQCPLGLILPAGGEEVAQILIVAWVRRVTFGCPDVAMVAAGRDYKTLHRRRGGAGGENR